MTINQTLMVVLKAQNQTAAAFNELNRNLGQMKHAAEALVGALAFKDVIDSTNQLGQQVDMLRDSLGITAEEASRLNYAARVVGSSADEVSQSFGALNRKIIDQAPLLQKGTSDFQKWGVTVQDAQGNILTFPEVLNNVRNRLRELPAGFERSGAAMDLMGRNGRQLLDLMTLTDAQFQSLSEEAQQMGLAFSDAGVDSLEEFQRNLNRLDLQFDAIKLQIGQFLIPILRNLLQWIKENNGGIKAFGETLARGAGVVKEWASTIGLAWDKLKQIFGSIGSVELALDALVLAFAALTGGPIGLALAAIVLAFLEVQKTIDFVKDHWDIFVYALKTGQLNDIPVFGFFFHMAQDVLRKFDELTAAKRAFDVMMSGGVQNAGGPNVINPRGLLGREGEGVQTVNTANIVGGAIAGANAGSAGGVITAGLGAVIGAVDAAVNGGGVTTTIPVTVPAGGGGGAGSNISMFAEGGIVRRPTLGMVGEAGPEAIIPLGQMAGNNITINIPGNVFAGSAREIAEAIADEVGNALVKRTLVNRNLAY